MAGWPSSSSCPPCSPNSGHDSASSLPRTTLLFVCAWSAVCLFARSEPDTTLAQRTIPTNVTLQLTLLRTRPRNICLVSVCPFSRLPMVRCPPPSESSYPRLAFSATPCPFRPISPTKRSYSSARSSLRPVRRTSWLATWMRPFWERSEPAPQAVFDHSVLNTDDDDL